MFRCQSPIPTPNLCKNHYIKTAGYFSVFPIEHRRLTSKNMFKIDR